MQSQKSSWSDMLDEYEIRQEEVQRDLQNYKNNLERRSSRISESSSAESTSSDGNHKWVVIRISKCRSSCYPKIAATPRLYNESDGVQGE